MKIMLISENVDFMDDNAKFISEYAHQFTTYITKNADDFLKREDSKRFDMIFVRDTDKQDAIEKIKEKLPNSIIIVINNGENYTHPDAFATLHSPLKYEELKKVCNEANHKLINHPSENVIDECFKSLTFKSHIQAKVPIEVRWRTMKAKELFTYLLVHKNDFQSKKTIQDMFWKELSEKSVTQQLYSTVYEIRKTIEKYNIPVEIVNAGDKYMMKSESLWVDYQMFEKQLKEIEQVTEENYERLMTILNMYTGHLLEIEEYSWTVNKREELRFLWLIYMEKLRDYYIEGDNINEAIILNLKMRELLPHNKMVENNLNKLYERIGEPSL